MKKTVIFSILMIFILSFPVFAGEPVISVKIEKACPMDINNIITAPAEIVPYNKVNIAAKIMGYIKTISGEEGEAVSSGEVVITIDDRDIVANLNMAQETLKEAQAAREAAEAQMDYAKKQMNRMKNLVSQSATNKAAYDQTEAGYQAAVGAFNQTNAKIGQAQAAITNAKVMLSYTKLTSPVNGVIIKKSTDVGNLTAPGQPLLSIDRMEKLYVVASVNEKDVTHIKIGGNAQVEIDALGKTYDGKIFTIIPSGDRITRTFTVKVILDNKDLEIKPGMYAKLHITRFSRNGVLAVPKKSIVTRDNKQYVFFMNEGETKVKQAQIELGIMGKDYVEVKSGLKSCVLVVTDGEEYLADGDTVSIIK